MASAAPGPLREYTVRVWDPVETIAIAGGGNALKGRGATNRGRAKRARPASQGAPEPNWDDLPDDHAVGDAPATSVPRPRPRRRCVRSPHRDRDADAALGHAIALSYAQGPVSDSASFLNFR